MKRVAEAQTMLAERYYLHILAVEHW
jgi:hypothetical protein